jgi:hypothetical protein
VTSISATIKPHWSRPRIGDLDFVPASFALLQLRSELRFTADPAAFARSKYLLDRTPDIFAKHDAAAQNTGLAISNREQSSYLPLLRGYAASADKNRLEAVPQTQQEFVSISALAD